MISAVLDNLDRIGGERDVELRLRRFEDDVRYAQSITQELLRDYLDKWVAISDKEVAAKATTIRELWRQLSSKGISPQDAYVFFVSKEKKQMLL